MKNIDNHWNRIAQSPWGRVYLDELYWLARDTSRLCSEIFEDAPAPPPTESYLAVDHRLHGKIYRILNNSARIGSLIKERARRDQSAAQYAIQQQRVKWLQSALEGLEIKELLNPKVRHSLEHFDEFIDETALKSSRGDIRRPSFFPIDMALGREDTLQVFANKNLAGAASYPLRVYLGEEQTFVNCGRRVDLGRIATECAAISERVAEIQPSVQQDGVESSEHRGSSLLVITEESFQDARP